MEKLSTKTKNWNCKSNNTYLFRNNVEGVTTSTKRKSTPTGLEPARRNSSRFRIYRLNHSATVSTVCGVFAKYIYATNRPRCLLKLSISSSLSCQFEICTVGNDHLPATRTYKAIKISFSDYFSCQKYPKRCDRNYDNVKNKV